jgi:hypothetical protein
MTIVGGLDIHRKQLTRCSTVPEQASIRTFIRKGT